jgi:hypothetical protein
LQHISIFLPGASQLTAKSIPMQRQVQELIRFQRDATIAHEAYLSFDSWRSMPVIVNSSAAFTGSTPRIERIQFTLIAETAARIGQQYRVRLRKLDVRSVLPAAGEAFFNSP